MCLEYHLGFYGALGSLVLRFPIDLFLIKFYMDSSLKTRIKIIKTKDNLTVNGCVRIICGNYCLVLIANDRIRTWFNADLMAIFVLVLMDCVRLSFISTLMLASFACVLATP